MGRSWKIWNEVTACLYQTGKSYGIKDTGEVNIHVGESAKNTNEFLTHVTTRRFYNHETFGDICSFRFSVDGEVLKEMIFKDENGKCGKHLYTMRFYKMKYDMEPNVVK